MKKKFIVKLDFPGLGDHLFYSHLPKIAKELGYEKVFVSNRSAFRYEEYRKLVWECNPFIDGFCDEDAPALPIFQFIPPGTNLLDKIMIEHGLDDGKRFHEPEVYYQPQIIPELSNATVFDPNYFSVVGNVSNEKLRRLLQEQGGIDFQMRVRGKAYGAQDGVSMLDASDVFHYCNIIASCKRFMCLTSGGATLAAALKKPATVFYGSGQLPMFRHSRLHTYVNVSSLFQWTASRPKYIFRKLRYSLDGRAVPSRTRG